MWSTRNSFGCERLLVSDIDAAVAEICRCPILRLAANVRARVVVHLGGLGVGRGRALLWLLTIVAHLFLAFHRTEFGRDEGATEMLLQAKDVIAKEKWLSAFSMDLNHPPKDYERLICEGYLIKVQPMCTIRSEILLALLPSVPTYPTPCSSRACTRIHARVLESYWTQSCTAGNLRVPPLDPRVLVFCL